MGYTAKSSPVNWTLLRAVTDNDKQAIKEVVLIYLRQGARNVKALRSAVRRDDLRQVAVLAHRFLGSSRFFGATAIGKPLAALLKMSRSQRLSPKAAALVERTEKEFVRISQFLKAPHV